MTLFAQVEQVASMDRLQKTFQIWLVLQIVQKVVAKQLIWRN